MPRMLSRRDVARYVAKQLVSGASRDKIVKQLAAYLIETRRTNEIGVMVRDIAFFLAEQGHVAGTLVSARELSQATLAAIQDFAQKETGATKVSLDTLVDESLLGGIRLELPGRKLDATIAHSLTILKTRYKKA